MVMYFIGSSKVSLRGTYICTPCVSIRSYSMMVEISQVIHAREMALASVLPPVIYVDSTFCRVSDYLSPNIHHQSSAADTEYLS